MKKTYSRKQIEEAISYWKKQLREAQFGGKVEVISMLDFKNEYPVDDSRMNYAVYYRAEEYPQDEPYGKQAEFLNLVDAQKFADELSKFQGPAQVKIVEL